MTGGMQEITPGFVQITSPGGGLRSHRDQDAGVAWIQLTGEPVRYGDLAGGKERILEYGRGGRLAAVRLLHCSEGVSTDEAPEDAAAEVRRAAEALGMEVTGES